MARPPDKRSVAESLQVLDLKLKQLKHEYEQYFRGNRPREPILLRGEVQKIVNVFANSPIGNTALRFRFNNLCSRFFALRRQWDTILRQIEEGTYKPHLFKAELHERQCRPGRARSRGGAGGSPRSEEELFEAYVAARQACGEKVAGLTPERLRGVLEQQRQALRQRYGCDEVRFRVVVEQGRTKLKATPVGKPS